MDAMLHKRQPKAFINYINKSQKLRNSKLFYKKQTSFCIAPKGRTRYGIYRLAKY